MKNRLFHFVTVELVMLHGRITFKQVLSVIFTSRSPLLEPLRQRLHVIAEVLFLNEKLKKCNWPTGYEANKQASQVWGVGIEQRMSSASE